MKTKILMVFFLLTISAFIKAQTPQSFNYQAVVRNADGTTITNQPIAAKISIIGNNINGSVLYTETHSVSTNNIGLINLTIGTGNVSLGSFSNINWANDLYFIKIEIDPNGGNNYQISGVSQLLSVPYAMYAQKAGNVNLSDTSSTNELQTISILGNDLSISNGNTVTLPIITYIAGTGINISGNTISSTISGNATHTGDATGATNLSVVKIQGNPVASGTPINGQILKWNNTSNIWEFANDLNTTYSAGTNIGIVGNVINNNAPNANHTGDATGSTALTVVAIQGYAIATTTPSDGQVLKWDGANNKWIPSTFTTGGSYNAGSGIDITDVTISNTAPNANHTGDATGSGALTVTGIQGKAIANTNPTDGYVLKWNTLNNRWEPSADLNTTYTAGTGISISGTTINNTLTSNATHTGDAIGSGALTVTRIQGNQVLAGTPTNGQILKWNTTNARWEASTDLNTTYTAGTGINISGTTINSTVTGNATHSGDASGATAITVTGIQGNPVLAGTPTNGQILKWNTTNARWEASTDLNTTYTAGTGISISGTTINNTLTSNATHTGDATGSGALSVVALRGRTISTTAPTTNQFLKWNSTLLQWEPSTINQSQWITSGNNIYNGNTGNVGIGTSTPNSKLEVKGTGDTLFQVKDANGNPVFIVFPEGVRVIVKEGAVKGNLGGFAVSGRSASKATYEDVLIVTPDSTRVFVNQNAKGNLGGFAVSGRSASKGLNTFTHLVPDNYFIGHQAGKSISTGKYNSFIGYESGYSTNTGSKNYFIGYRSGYKNTNGFSNIFIGDSTGINNTSGYQNVYIGNQAALSAGTGYQNVLMGFEAGKNITSGFRNVFIGPEAGYKNGSSRLNIAIGYQAGYNNTGWMNMFIGVGAGFRNTTAVSNIFIGTNAGYYNETGGFNTFMGWWSGLNNFDGTNNLFLGSMAGGNNISGSDNVYLGYGSGNSNTTGINNTFIGSNSGSDNYGSNNVFIGYSAGSSASGSNKLYISNSNTITPLIYGDFSSKFVGIGETNAPISTVHILNKANVAGARGLTVDTDGESTDIPFKIRTVADPSSTTHTDSDSKFTVYGNGKVEIEGALQLTGGTTFTKIQAGTATLGTGSVGVNTFTITFPSAFTGIPKITVTTRNVSATYTDVYAVTTRNITSTTFQVNVYRIDNSGGTWGQALLLDWVAWE